MITANDVLQFYYYNLLKAYLLFNPLSFYEDFNLKSGFLCLWTLALPANAIAFWCYLSAECFHFKVGMNGF